MGLGVSSSYAVLCVVQGVLVGMPWRPWRLVRSRRAGALVGLAVPAAALALGVWLILGPDAGAETLAGLAGVVAPVGAAAVAWAWRWPLAWLGPPAALALWLTAWRVPGRPGDLAGVILIAAACLTLAALIASLAPRAAVAVGLVGLAALDAILVFGADAVAPASTSLHQVAPPALAVPGVADAHPLPALQDAAYGTAFMGWLDLLAPALLATVVAVRVRARLVAAVVTSVAAVAFGLLLQVTSPLPATVPVLAGLAAGLAYGRSRGSSRRTVPTRSIARS